MTKRIALLTGITGQDASYLAELLLSKNYEVHGTIRRSSSPNTQRIDHIFDPESRQFIHYGDLTNGIENLIYEIKPDEIYNLAAQSHVRVSFDLPIYTAEATGIAVLRLLEAIRQGIKTGILSKDIKFYQASSSELFGTTPPPHTETSQFNPVSPYGIAKQMGFYSTRAYRNGYNMFACTGILFNHESERRGINFVTRKITMAAAKIKLGLQKQIELGNLDAKRDWGHSADYVRAIYMIMQHSVPDEFVVSTGEYHTVREFAEKVFNHFDLDFYKYWVNNDQLRRPNEVPALLGDSTKIRTVLGWKPEICFDDLIKRMCDNDYNIVKKLLV